jgi:hypothetical protein
MSQLEQTTSAPSPADSVTTYAPESRLLQTKLTGDEWTGVEIMEPENEMRILNLIVKGFHDVNYKFNTNLSLASRLKVTTTPEMIDHLYSEYFKKRIDRIIAENSDLTFRPIAKSKKQMKKVDLMRIQNMNTMYGGGAGAGGRDASNNNAVSNTSNASNNDPESGNSLNTYDHLILETIEQLVTAKRQQKTNTAAPAAAVTQVNEWMKHYYTLAIMLEKSINDVNMYITEFANYILKHYQNDISITAFIRNAYKYIEQNENIFKYADYQLYEHQKELFTVTKRDHAKLVLYIAPTGTGKTLSPLGLSEKYKVIFVCAARHVGLALAKAAISVKKRIAFAFGCGNIDDIRLHYFAAKEAIRDKRSGRIRKVDNSIGDNVEIMICDIRSYLLAMRYMMAFHPLDKLLMYWDEPTISLDYADHPLHPIIHRNWAENQIPNVVLSSATLPREGEMVNVIQDFKVKFQSADEPPEIYSIVSHDFKKSIPIINQGGFVELPHYMFGSDYSRVLECVEHCKTYKTLMRYFDLREIIRFIGLVTKRIEPVEDSDSEDSDSEDAGEDAGAGAVTGHKAKAAAAAEADPDTDDNRGLVISSERYLPENMFGSISDITMTSIKEYYLLLLENIRPKYWERINETLQRVRKPLFASVINLSTGDAHTLTDGPTIYLTENVDKVAAYMLQIAKIPNIVMDDIMGTIDYNTRVLEEIEKLEKTIKDLEGESKDPSSSADGGDKKTRKYTSDTRVNPETDRMHIKIEELRKSVKYTALNDLFVPNRLEHLKRWTSKMAISNEYTSFVEDEFVEQIMLLNVETHWKLLLLMGIGAITNTTNQKYTDIMKTLAKHQKLYLIITATDYIYGTNYQFCHGYLGKDLETMSQEKAIQSMGRIGRGSIQQDYTIRARHDAIISRIFTSMQSEDKPEVCAMKRLFVSA